MRWRGIIIFCLASLCLWTPSWAALSGRATVTYGTIETSEDGEEVMSSRRLNQNYTLSFTKPVTPFLRYNIGLQTTISDRTTTTEGVIRKRFQRTIAPSLDLNLANPYYDFYTGYVRREQWSTASLEDESRLTSDSYYANLELHRRSWYPDLLLEFSRAHTYDHLPVRNRDTTSTSYSASTSRAFNLEDFRTFYSLNYNRSEADTPLSQVNKTVSDNYSVSYSASYSRSFWKNRATLSARYNGIYLRVKTDSSVSESGDIVFERATLEGLHAVGSALEPDVEVLGSESALIDGDTDAGISAINLGTEQFHNIGLRLVSITQSVDRVYVYVDRDVGLDAALSSAANWRAFRSNSNIEGATWAEVSILSVSISEFDTINQRFRYEIIFASAQQGPFFKVVNLETVNAPGLTDVLVTEIEALGMETVPETGILTTESESMTQGVRLSMLIRPAERWSFDVNASVDRTDSEPDSILGSVGGTFANMGSKSIGGDGEQASTVRRAFGAGANWKALAHLETSLRFQRSEFFDNHGAIDTSVNSYSLSLFSSPIPTVDARFSADRTESYNFSEKKSTTHSFLFSAGTKFYPGLNMLTDASYTVSKSEETGVETTAKSLGGHLDARLTQELFSTLIYNLSWSDSEDASSRTRQASVSASYRPAKFVNLAGSFSVLDTDDMTRTSEAVTVNWLAAPVLRLNASYARTETHPGTDSDTVTTSAYWSVSRSLNVRVAYSYSRNERESVTTSHAVTATVSGSL